METQYDSQTQTRPENPDLSELARQPAESGRPRATIRRPIITAISRSAFLSTVVLLLWRRSAKRSQRKQRGNAGAGRPGSTGSQPDKVRVFNAWELQRPPAWAEVTPLPDGQQEWLEMMCQEVVSQVIVLPQEAHVRSLIDQVRDGLSHEKQVAISKMEDALDGQLYEAIALLSRVAPVMARLFIAPEALVQTLIAQEQKPARKAEKPDLSFCPAAEKGQVQL